MPTWEWTFPQQKEDGDWSWCLPDLVCGVGSLEHPFHGGDPCFGCGAEDCRTPSEYRADAIEPADEAEHAELDARFGVVDVVEADRRRQEWREREAKERVAREDRWEDIWDCQLDY